MKKILLIVLLIFPINAHARTFEEITSLLLNASLTQQTPKTITQLKTPWGPIKSQIKNEEDGWIFSTNSSPYLFEIAFAFDGSNWLLNDASISIYTNAAQCTKNLNTLKIRFNKLLGPPLAENDTEGFFWQLTDKEWGIWASQIETLHPKTQDSTCATKAILAYGADEYLSEDEAF